MFIAPLHQICWSSRSDFIEEMYLVCAMDNCTTSMVPPAFMLRPEISRVFFNLFRQTLKPRQGWSAACNQFYRTLSYMTPHFIVCWTRLFKSWYGDCVISVSGKTWQLVSHSLILPTRYSCGRCSLYYIILTILDAFLCWSKSRQPVTTAAIVKKYQV